MTHPRAWVEPDLPEFLSGAVSEPDDTPRRSSLQRTVKERQGHIPGEGGLWIFLLGDMTLFALILLVFLWERRSDADSFQRSAHQLIQPIGAANTLVLLLSSYLVVQALSAHRSEIQSRARQLVFGAVGCAAMFACLKGIEYYGEISAGNTPASGMFFTFYFILTGLHLLHVIVGTALLLVWQRKLACRDPWLGSQKLTEGIASYWHMVDLLWVAIFALVYLVSAE